MQDRYTQMKELGPVVMSHIKMPTKNPPAAIYLERKKIVKFKQEHGEELDIAKNLPTEQALKKENKYEPSNIRYDKEAK